MAVYKVFNKTYQPIILVSGQRIAKRSFVIVKAITAQIRNLEDRGFLTVRKM